MNYFITYKIQLLNDLTPKTTETNPLVSSWNESTLNLVARRRLVFLWSPFIHDERVYIDPTNPQALA